MNWKEFLAWEKATDEVIALKPIYIDIAGDIVSGLMLSQLVYWYLPSKNGGAHKLRVKRDGHFWVVKTKEEWYSECRITPQNYRTAISKLEKQNLIIKFVGKSNIYNGKTVTHIRLNVPVFLTKLNEQLDKRKQDVISTEDEFGAYIEEQMEEKEPNQLPEPLIDKGSVESTPPEMLNQHIEKCGNNMHIGNDDSTRPLYTETTEITDTDFDKDLNLNLYDILWNLKLPKSLKVKIKVNLVNKVFNLSEQDLFDIESAYDYQIKQSNIIPDCDSSEIYALNDDEFTNTLIQMLTDVKNIENMKGSIKKWVGRGIEFKINNFSEFESSNSRQALFSEVLEELDA